MLTQAIAHLTQVDPVLEKIIGSTPPPQVLHTDHVFHDLMSCVLEQQIHYRSTKKIFQKMLNTSNITILTPDNFFQFEKRAFEGTKLSINKYETIMRIVDFWHKNDIKWHQLTDTEVRNKLSEIKGVGAWTIDMILLYTLNRPDIYSFDDFHIKQVMTLLYGLNPESKLKANMMEIAEPWSPYKSTAFLYLLEWKKGQKAVKPA